MQVLKVPSPLTSASIRDKVGLRKVLFKWQSPCYCCQTACS